MIASLLAVTMMPQISADYKLAQLKWRQEVEDSLKGPEGWLAVAGLFWLSPGTNTVGTASQSAVVLPARLGNNLHLATLTLSGTEVTLQVQDQERVKVNGKSVESMVLKADSSGSPDVVQVGTVKFRIIVRGKRVGVRMIDPESEALREFKGCKWFPLSSKFHFRAKYTAYNPVHSVDITNVLGDVSPVKVPGYVEFTIRGKTYKLDAQDAGDGLFINFRDKTSGDKTYPAGRFLDAPKPMDGFVDLDFNRATNPPCAFTSFATCPLPPRQNVLPVAIEAGELSHHPGH